MGLLWGYGGVNISPMAVPAPEEDFDIDIDFDEFLSFYECPDSSDYDADDFEELAEYLDNQQW